MVHAGVEADDVIGTVATQAAAAGWRVVVSSSDKDFTQLVSDEKRITLLDHKSQQLDEEGVRARMGVPPHLVVDLLALMGDKVDTIPCNHPDSNPQPGRPTPHANPRLALTRWTIYPAWLAWARRQPRRC